MVDAGKERTTLRALLGSYTPFALKLTVSIGLIVYLFYDQIGNVDAIWQAMSQADPILLLLAFSLNTIGYLLCSWRWQLLLKAQGFVVPLIKLIRAYTIGIFFNSFLPGLMSGDLMRALDISDRVTSYVRSFLILFVERLTGMYGLLFLAVAAVAMIGRDAIEETRITYLLLLIGGILMGLTAVFFSRTFRAAMMRLISLPFLRGLSGIMTKITDTSEAFATRMNVVYACVGISIAFQANVVLHYYLIGRALEIHLPLITYFAIIPASLFVMMIPASVNGIGIREQIFIFLLGQFGVAPHLAVSLAWIAFAMVLVQAVAGGIVFAMRRRTKLPPVAEIDGSRP